jgi:hypothetical protein
MCEAVLDEVIGAASLYRRQSAEALEKILASGRFKSQFETRTSSGYYDPPRRKTAEEASLGLPRDLPDRRRPIYGYLSTAGRPERHVAAGYGSVVVRFKPAVRDRTRLTCGDSLIRVAHVQSSPVTAPSLRSMQVSIAGNDFDVVQERQSKTPLEMLQVLTARYNYVEAQFMDGVAADEIEEVLFEGPPPPDLTRILDQRGIAWSRT